MAAPSKSRKAAPQTAKATQPKQGQLSLETQETTASPQRVANNTLTAIILGVYHQDKDGQTYANGRVSIMAKQTASVNFGTKEAPDWQNVVVPHNGKEVFYFTAFDEMAERIAALKAASSELILAVHYEYKGLPSNVNSNEVARGDQTYTNHVFADPSLLSRKVEGFDIVHSKLSDANA